MSNVSQLKHDKLSALFGLANNKDLERQYVRSLITVPPSDDVKQLDDLWSILWDQEGIAQGKFPDRAQEWLIGVLSQPGATVYPEWDDEIDYSGDVLFSGGRGYRVGTAQAPDGGGNTVHTKVKRAAADGGKWYAEVFVWPLPYYEIIGVVRRGGDSGSQNYSKWHTPGSHNYSWGWNHYDQNVKNAGVAFRSGMPFPWASNWRIRIALDLDNGRLWFGYPGGWCGAGGNTSGNPATGADPLVSGLPISGDEVYAVSAFGYYANATMTCYANSTETPFKYAVPAGYSAWQDNYVIPPVSPENTELPQLWWEYWNAL